jgi:arylsulfatase A-like enzyme/Tfp pilus assembly protein PilF
LRFVYRFMRRQLFNSGHRSASVRLIFCLGCALGVACGRGQDRPSLAHDQFHGANVLLITIDTLRADRLGAYGNPSGLTPTLDALAGRGVRYAHAISHAPMTLPAHTAILTGLSPRLNGVRNNTTFRLDDRVPTLATFLKRAGYRTGAFVGAFVLDGRFGLAKDFDEYDDRLPHAGGASFHFSERRGDAVVKAATDWILGSARRDESQPTNSRSTNPESPIPNPFFAWVHLFDPHTPYDAPPEFRPGRTPYDAEVAYADAMVGRLLDALRSAGQLDRTLVVVTADHGESLGEHGETTHGLFAYESTIHIPLIVAAPAVRPGVEQNNVAHVDLVPTILDLVGVPIPEGLEGRSLAGPVPADRTLYFEALDAYLTRGWAPLKGIVQGGWKFIDLPEAELYDLAADPAEAHNAIGRGDRANTMQKALAAMDSAGGASAPAAPLDVEAAGRLRSLGYVGGAVARGSPPAVADDPKRLVTLNEQFNSALTSFEDGRPEDALAGFAAVLAARRDFATARTSAATVLLSQGRGREAVQLLRDTPPAQRQNPQVLAKLGAALRDSGDLPAAAATLEEARRAGAGNDALEDLAVVYASQGRTDLARKTFDEAVKRNPSATTWFNVGLFELQSRQPTAAAAAFRHAVEREPLYGQAWQALGAALAASDPAAAIDAWRHAEPLLPRNYDLLFNLGMLTAQSAHPADAIPYLRRFVDEAPRDRYKADIARVQQELTVLERRK